MQSDRDREALAKLQAFLGPKIRAAAHEILSQDPPCQLCENPAVLVRPDLIEEAEGIRIQYYVLCAQCAQRPGPWNANVD
jgi:hypothetical protein